MIKEDVIIRRPTLSDAQDIFEYCSDAETIKWLSFPLHKTIDDSISGLKNFILPQKHEYAMDYKGKCIGTVGARHRDGKTYEIGYVLNPKYRGKGITTYCVKLLIEKLKREEGDNIEIILNYYDTNLASKRVSEKCGFIPTGRITEKEIKGVLRKLVEVKLP